MSRQSVTVRPVDHGERAGPFRWRRFSVRHYEPAPTLPASKRSGAPEPQAVRPVLGLAGGTSATYADMLLKTFRAARRRDFAMIDPALRWLVGRQPRTLGDVLASASP